MNKEWYIKRIKEARDNQSLLALNMILTTDNNIKDKQKIFKEIEKAKKTIKEGRNMYEY
jgi:hypothetical protein